jgi:hypothetical protein
MGLIPLSIKGVRNNQARCIGCIAIPDLIGAEVFCRVNIISDDSIHWTINELGYGIKVYHASRL